MKGFRDLPTNLICKRDQRFFLHNNFITGRKGRVSTLNIVSVLKKNSLQNHLIARIMLIKDFQYKRVFFFDTDVC